MSRLWPLLAFLAAAAAKPDSLDQAFTKAPFEQWLLEGSPGPMHWSVSVARPDLSFHQRLFSRVEIKVDGKDLAQRRGQGQLVIFIQLSDPAGARYQQHDAIDLSKLDENIKAAELTYAQSMFLLPGEYKLAVAILDTKTGEHGCKQLPLRLQPGKLGPDRREFVPDAWRDLKPVEFLYSEEAPDSWYQPRVEGRLNWGLRPGSEIAVILNVSAQRGAGLTALLPTLKAITQAAPAARVTVKVLDVHGRHVLMKERDAAALSWEDLKDAVAEKNTATVDIKALGERRRDAQFFVREMGRTLRARQEKACAVVVLTGPLQFEQGEDLQPIALESKPACAVTYIRYHAPRQNGRMLPPHMGGRRGRGGLGGPPPRRLEELQIDELEGTLKPLNPKVFDVETAGQMARALESLASPLRADR